MRKIIFILALLSYFSTSAQVMEEKEIQKASEKEIGAVGKFGIKSAVKGGGDGPLSRAMIAAFEVTKLDGDGFVIRNGYSFKKFDKGMNLQWEATLSPSVGLQAQPTNVSIGNQDFFYFIEMSTNYSVDVFITKIDNSGKSVKTKYSGAKEDKNSNAYLSFFLSDKGINILEFTGSKSPAQHTHTLLTFSKMDLTLSKASVKGLEPDAFELEKTPVFGNKTRLYTWNQLKVIKDKIVLVKCYRNETKTSPVEEYTIKTIELSFTGETGNAKNFVVKDTKSHRWPSVELSADAKDLYIFGYSNTESDLVTNGIFVHKYNYGTGSSVYQKEYKNAAIVPNVSIEDSKMSAYLIYPTMNMVEGVYEFDNNNGELNFTLYKIQKSGFSNAYFYNVNIDAEGKVTYVNEVEYSVPPLVYKRFTNNIVDTKLYENRIPNGSLFIRPVAVKSLYKTASAKSISPLEFIISKGGADVKNQTFYSVLPMSDCNMVIEINDETSSIKGYKLKK